jgi:hypothetical protein
MEIVSIGLATVENIKTALLSIGFVEDSEDNTILYWDNDSNRKLNFSISISGNNTIMRFQNSAGTILYSSTAWSPTYNYKMAYELIGDGIVFGFSRLDVNYNTLNFAIIAPESQNDSWLYNGFSNNNIYDGTAETYTTYGNKITSNSSAIQLIKYFNNIRFADNLMLAVVCPTIPLQTATQENFLGVTLGNDDYLLVTTGANNSAPLALKRTTT